MNDMDTFIRLSIHPSSQPTSNEPYKETVLPWPRMRLNLTFLCLTSMPVSLWGQNESEYVCVCACCLGMCVNDSCFHFSQILGDLLVGLRSLVLALMSSCCGVGGILRRMLDGYLFGYWRTRYAGRYTQATPHPYNCWSMYSRCCLPVRMFIFVCTYPSLAMAKCWPERLAKLSCSLTSKW